VRVAISEDSTHFGDFFLKISNFFCAVYETSQKTPLQRRGAKVGEINKEGNMKRFGEMGTDWAGTSGWGPSGGGIDRSEARERGARSRWG